MSPSRLQVSDEALAEAGRPDPSRNSPRWPLLVLRLLLGWVLVVPHAAALGNGTGLGWIGISELIIGVCMALGLATRYAAGAGVVLMAVQLKGLRPSVGPPLWLILLLIVILTDGGRSMSVDALWARRKGAAGDAQPQESRQCVTWPFVFLRLRLAWTFLGSSLVWYGYEDASVQLGKAVQSALDRGVALGIYEPFLTGVVLKNLFLFSILVRLGEFFVFLSMALGLGTRMGALVGMFLMISYGLMQAASLSMGIGPLLWFILFVVVYATAPGRVFGLDRALERRWGPSWLWTPGSVAQAGSEMDDHVDPA